MSGKIYDLYESEFTSPYLFAASGYTAGVKGNPITTTVNTRNFDICKSCVYVQGSAVDAGNAEDGTGFYIPATPPDGYYATDFDRNFCPDEDNDCDGYVDCEFIEECICSAGMRSLFLSDTDKYAWVANACYTNFGEFLDDEKHWDKKYELLNCVES